MPAVMASVFSLKGLISQSDCREGDASHRRCSSCPMQSFYMIVKLFGLKISGHYVSM